MAIKKSITSQPNQSAATKSVKNQTKVGSGFAPGSRPGVITRSGQNVFKDGKLVGRYNDETKAKNAVEEFTSRGQKGRITNIKGDTQGQTFRQLNRVDKGTQTGLANTGGIKSAVRSRGFVAETGVDEQGNERILGAQTPQGAKNIRASGAREKARQDQIERQSQRAYVAGQPFSRQAPVLKEEGKEVEARERIAKERGIDTKTASAGQIMRLNEAVNLDVYGTATPKFATGAGVLSATQKAQEQALSASKQRQATFAIPEHLNTGIDETVVTSKGAVEFSDSELAKFEEYNQENADEVTTAINGLLESDPDILSAQSSGDEMQSLLDERRKFYEEQYNSLQQQIQDIYDAKEADYKEQAAQAMGSAISQMAAIGAFGTTTAGTQYVDDVNRKNQAAIMALATEEATALNQAYSAFMEADFALAGEMITNAKNTRQEIRQIKADQLTRQKTLMELRQMEKADVGQTISAIVASGMTSEDLPEGYLEYLDQKSGYPSGTTSALMDVAVKDKLAAEEEKQFERETAEMEAFNTMLNTLPKLSPDQYIDYNGSRYYGKESSTEVIGTEIDKASGSIITITRDKITGDITAQVSKDVLTPNVSYSKEWVKNADGSESLWYVPDDPTQGSAIPATGGQTGGAQGINGGALQQSFPAGMTYAEAVKQDPSLTESDFWCLRWGANLDVRGQDLINEVGDTIQEKRASVEADIGFGEGARPPQVGDYMLTNEDSTYGHFMLINDIRTDPNTGKQVAVVSESNGPRFNNGTSGGPLTVAHTRTITLDSSNLESNGGKILGFKHSELKPEYTSQAPTAGGQLTSYAESEEADITEQRQIRKEIASDSAIAQYGELKNSYQSMNAVANAAVSGDAEMKSSLDQALITLFNKMLDPTSVVREGEYARTAEGQSVLARMSGYMQQLGSGGAGIDDAARLDMVNTAKILFDVAEGRYNDSVSFYVPILEDYNLDPAMFIKGYSPSSKEPGVADVPSQVTTTTITPDVQSILDDYSDLSEEEIQETLNLWYTNY